MLTCSRLQHDTTIHNNCNPTAGETIETLRVNATSSFELSMDYNDYVDLRENRLVLTQSYQNKKEVLLLTVYCTVANQVSWKRGSFSDWLLLLLYRIWESNDFLQLPFICPTVYIYTCSPCKYHSQVKTDSVVFEVIVSFQNVNTHPPKFEYSRYNTSIREVSTCYNHSLSLVQIRVGGKLDCGPWLG